jgi:histidyl-tRNA synthetase
MEGAGRTLPPANTGPTGILPFPAMAKPQQIQAPKGMRDYYPADMLRRRFIEKAWRDVSIRHGFEEIDGPTFEHTDLYTVKSGEGILAEIFAVFSGKDPQQVADAASGRAQYALRPEFTPTLARMYAARAGQLGKPVKWFWQNTCFRAERPQRGRLREFLQWNIDFIGGDDPAAADAETIACCIDLLAGLGLSPQDVHIRVNDRRLVADLLTELGVDPGAHSAAMTILDRADRMSDEEAARSAQAAGLHSDLISRFRAAAAKYMNFAGQRPADADLERMPGLRSLVNLFDALTAMGHGEWLHADSSIVRGLAYYTGMVFEVYEATGAERAIAGGGRYDNLIELFGGPPTPAVGFGMGDVVLSLVLADRNLMPEGAALLDRISSPGPSLRPDVFIISSGTPEADAQVRPLLAQLRRGGDSAPPLHARTSYKATKNIGKLLKEASDSFARYAVIVETGDAATVKDLGARTEDKMALADLPGHLAQRNR